MGSPGGAPAGLAFGGGGVCSCLCLGTLPWQGVPGGCHTPPPPPTLLYLGGAKAAGVGGQQGESPWAGGGGWLATPMSPQATPMSPRARQLSWQRHLLAVPSSLRTGLIKDRPR